MTINSRFKRFDYLSWPQAEKVVNAKGATLIWPFGACEQHGPHLPLATDNLFAEHLAAKVLEKLPSSMPIWRLPSQGIGFSPEHASFPGTISISGTLLLQLIMEVGQQLASMGISRLVLFNAHGGQIGLLEAAARQLRMKNPSMAVLPCFLWRGVPSLEDLIPSKELKTDLHAGLAETSLMLSLEPELVGKERPLDGEHQSPASIATPPEGWSLEGPVPCAWLTKDLSSSGVIGDSRGANPRLGQDLEIALVNHWIKLFSSLMGSNWPPTGEKFLSDDTTD